MTQDFQRNTLGEVLWWLYYQSGGFAKTWKISALYRMQMGGRGGASVSGYDAAIQSGMIHSFLMRLPHEEFMHLAARYLNERHAAEAAAAIVPFIASRIPGHKPDQQLLNELVSSYYWSVRTRAHRESKRKGPSGPCVLVTRFSVTRRAFEAIRKEVYVTLRALSFRAETKVEERFKAHGVIA